MKKNRFIDELSEQLAELLPQAEAAGEDIRKGLSSGLQKGFSKMDLLTREEFEQQARALEKAEQRIAALEISIAELEKRLQQQLND